MEREMTGAEMVIQAMADQGVKHLFGYPGGAVEMTSLCSSKAVSSRSPSCSARAVSRMAEAGDTGTRVGLCRAVIGHPGVVSRSSFEI